MASSTWLMLHEKTNPWGNCLLQGTAALTAPLRTIARMAGPALLILVTALGSATATAQTSGSSSTATESLAPFVPTPSDVVERMLALADVGPQDLVYDLGSGDGRIVITAAQKLGARGVGIEIDPRLILQAEANARAAGVEDRVTFVRGDALAADVSDATVVTLYLLSASNVKLRPILTRQLHAGSRIVSHNFAIGEWEPDLVDTFHDAAGTRRTLYLWNFDGRYRP